jgi:DNA-binding protein H-NS
MAKSLDKVLAQIEQLQRQADVLRKKEIAGVVARIQEAIEHYNLTPEELFGGTGSRGRTSRRGKNVPAGQTKAGAPKYQGPEGQTWTGVGKRPRWFVEALASGKSAEDLLVKAASPSRASKKLRGKPAGAARTEEAGVPKYRSEDGRTWTGRGKRPAWFVEALAAGKTADDMLVSSFKH